MALRIGLVGDSITKGYMIQLSAEARGAGDYLWRTVPLLIRPSSVEIDASKTDWIGGENNLDVLVINAGLHDCVHDGSQTGPWLVSPENYVSSFESILTYIKSETEIKLVVPVTTTPVLESVTWEGSHAQYIQNSDIDDYNILLLNKMAEHGWSKYIDLNWFVKNNTYGVSPNENDGIHYSDGGKYGGPKNLDIGAWMAGRLYKIIGGVFWG